MSYPQRGTILSTDWCYMFAYNSSTVYTATLIAVEGQTTKSFIFDPRTSTTPCLVSFQYDNTVQRMTAKNTTGTNVIIGYTNGYLDVSSKASDIIPITTTANDDYYSSTDITSLVSVPYYYYYNGSVVPFYSYIPDGNGGIQTDSSGNPLKQSLTGPFYLFTSIWYPKTGCGTGISEQSMITNAVTNWLKSSTMPSDRYYTNQADCNVGVEYSYCQFRELCTVNCNGPCVEPSQTCTYSTTNKSYYCPSNNGNNNGNNNAGIAWFFFIIILILIIIIVLSMIIT